MKSQSIDRPTRESLTAEYGFRVPEVFVTVVQIAFDSRREEDEPWDAFYDEICSLFLDPDCRYPQTPPELFPIGHMGVDGVHYGYVLHAPEIPQDDYPIGEFCPMDSVGVFLVGGDTPTAMENLISVNYRMEQEDEEYHPEKLALFRQRIPLISAALKIDPDPSKAERYDSEGNGHPVVPHVPEGWMYVPTADGIGVLAPRALFRPGEPPVLVEYPDPEVCLASGHDALRDGYPATALIHFREGFWYHWTDDDWMRPFGSGMSECYIALNRPTLTAVLERAIARHSGLSMPHRALSSPNE